MLVQTGTAEELYLRPANLFAAGFFSELNIFNGRASHGIVDTPLGKVAAEGFADGVDVTVAVRMSGFDVSETEGETEARILSRRYLGVVELIEFAVSGADKPVRASVRCGRLSAGARDIWLSSESLTYLCLNPATKTHRSTSDENFERE